VPEIAKTSLGASTMVPWELVPDDVSLVTTLQATGVTVVAVEQTANSISLTDFTVPPDVAYIMGNEVVGVPLAWCMAADYVVELPMYGQKESLNVGVAAGIVLYKS
jgi:tRNA G18 (ribose-2'-O)-methylase SpoU